MVSGMEGVLRETTAGHHPSEVRTAEKARKKTTRANCVGDGPESMDTDIAGRPIQSHGVQVAVAVVRRMDESTEWGMATATRV